jgi:hypothetical protein
MRSASDDEVRGHEDRRSLKLSDGLIGIFEVISQ